MIQEIRKAIKKEFPGFKFTCKVVSFQDFARDERIFVESKEWTPEKFTKVKEICKQFEGVIVSG